MIEEYKKNGYVIFDDLLPEEEYKKILDICKNSSYNKISQKRSDRYALWETPDDKFFPDSDEVYENQFWGTDEVVQTDEVKQMFDKNIKPKINFELGTQHPINTTLNFIIEFLVFKVF